MFMNAQGYEIKNNTVYQDNQSAMKMETNGRNSCTRNSWHINVRYFFVKDRINNEKFEVKYCLTLLMVADYFTKPLVGQRFRELKSVIMGHKFIFDLDKSLFQPIKEHVRFQDEL